MIDDIHSIHDIEDRMEVIMPDGHRGHIRVTRRERKLVVAGRLIRVDVQCSDGLVRNFSLSDLIGVANEVVEDE